MGWELQNRRPCCHLEKTQATRTDRLEGRRMGIFSESSLCALWAHQDRHCRGEAYRGVALNRFDRLHAFLMLCHPALIKLLCFMRWFEVVLAWAVKLKQDKVVAPQEELCQIIAVGDLVKMSWNRRLVHWFGRRYWIGGCHCSIIRCSLKLFEFNLGVWRRHDKPTLIYQKAPQTIARNHCVTMSRKGCEESRCRSLLQLYTNWGLEAYSDESKLSRGWDGAFAKIRGLRPQTHEVEMSQLPWHFVPKQTASIHLNAETNNTYAYRLDMK